MGLKIAITGRRWSWLATRMKALSIGGAFFGTIGYAVACTPDLSSLLQGWGGSGGTGSTTSGTTTSSSTTTTSSTTSASTTTSTSDSTSSASGTGGGSSGGDGGIDLIDDFEDGDGNTPPGPGRGPGHWGTVNDGISDGGVQTPAPFDTFTAKRIPEDAGHAGPPSNYAAFTNASGWTGYAQLYLTIDDATAQYDASHTKGIAFWIRSDTSTPARFAVPDKNTDPAGGVCSNQPAGCWNSFGIDLNPTTEWTWTELLWSDLSQQPGWGYQVDTGVATDTIYRLTFTSGPSGSLNIWIDDPVFLLK